MIHAKPKKQDITRNILATEMRHRMWRSPIGAHEMSVIMWRSALMHSDARWFPPRKIKAAVKKRRW